MTPENILKQFRITEINTNIIIFEELNKNVKWKSIALKQDYMFKELIKLGGDNESKYPNIAPIIDLHQDIELPEYTEYDKERAGIPSVFTNAT